MHTGPSHLSQTFLGDDAPSGSTSPDSSGQVPPGTLIPAPIITPSPMAKYKPLITIGIVAVIVYVIASRKK